jgi:hypothetical protein
VKKLAFLLVLFFVLSLQTSYAEIEVRLESVIGSEFSPLAKLEGHYSLLHINDMDYLWAGLVTQTKPAIQYNQREYEFFSQNGYEDYIWTGTYYMARDVVGDPRYNWKYWAEDCGPFPIRFYDKDFNLQKEVEFPSYPLEIGYYNDIYYVYLPEHLTSYSFGENKPEKYLMSTDLETWTEFSGSIPQHNDTVACFTDDVAFGGGDDFYDISYEDRKERSFLWQIGDWFIKRDKENLYFSNDNVYFVKLSCPEEAYLNELGFPQSLGFSLPWEDGDDLVIGATINSLPDVRLRVSKQELYDKLHWMKNAPYIKLDGKILGFEQCPIVEEDRTLVPMRFLFEQMGAEVDWDAATQTATAEQDNQVVAFGIGARTATVNEVPADMDVAPQLVNGKTMVPLRFLSENLGYDVAWDAETRVVTIAK